MRPIKSSDAKRIEYCGSQRVSTNVELLNISGLFMTLETVSVSSVKGRRSSFKGKFSSPSLWAIYPGSLFINL